MSLHTTFLIGLGAICALFSGCQSAPSSLAAPLASPASPIESAFAAIPETFFLHALPPQVPDLPLPFALQRIASPAHRQALLARATHCGQPHTDPEQCFDCQIIKKENRALLLLLSGINEEKIYLALVAFAQPDGRYTLVAQLLFEQSGLNRSRGSSLHAWQYDPHGHQLSASPHLDIHATPEGWELHSLHAKSHQHSDFRYGDALQRDFWQLCPDGFYNARGGELDLHRVWSAPKRAQWYWTGSGFLLRDW